MKTVTQTITVYSDGSINVVNEAESFEKLERLREAANQVKKETQKTRTPNDYRKKLTENDVYKIRALIADGFTNAKISALYDVTPGTISQIRTGHSWGNLQ